MEKGIEDVGFEVSLGLEFAFGASGGRERVGLVAVWG